MGSKDQDSTFSEHGHAAYQSKENHECSNVVANILPADPHPDPGVSRSKFMVMLHNKLKGITNAATFSEHGHVAYQIKGNHEFSNMVANVFKYRVT